MTAPTAAMDPEETLARWRAEESAVRARLQTAPAQIFQALLAGEIPPQQMA